jgi:hypothetical protein
MLKIPADLGPTSPAKTAASDICRERLTSILSLEQTG